MANSDGNYKVVLNGEYEGQAIVNVLYYRLGFDLIPGELNFAGAEDLAFQVKQEIWTPALKGMLPNGYTLRDITVYPYGNDFEPLFQFPFVMNVAEAAAGGATATNGPANCCILRFNLAPTSPLNGIFPPKKGYIAVGPLLDTYVDNTGHLPSSTVTAFQSLANRFAQTLNNAVPPATFVPIRVKQVKVLGILKIVSYADVLGVTVRSLASFRRSRQPEQ